MYYIFKVLQLLLLVTFQTSNANDNYFQDELDEQPCSAFDTKNITYDRDNENDASKYIRRIFYGNISHEPPLYRDYDYIYGNDNAKISVPIHVRGCVCINKICIRSCCDRRHAFNETTQRCSVETDYVNAWNVTIFNETNDRVDNYENLYDSLKYEVVMGRPCNEMSLLDVKNDLEGVSLQEV